MNKSAELAEPERVDNRGEWFHEWSNIGYYNQPPLIYWILLKLSAVWIIIYLLVYPSIPWFGTHWPGLGVPGGCRPWTAICEMHQDEAVLNNVRAKYLNKIAREPVDVLLQDAELSEFIHRVNRVKFSENCAGCHGVNGRGREAMPHHGLKLDVAELAHGSSVQQIHLSLINPAFHPAGMIRRMDETTQKTYEIYVFKLGEGARRWEVDNRVEGKL